MQRFTLANSARGVDFAQPEVIAVADVGDHGDVAAVEGQALAEDAAAGRFQHGRVDGRVHEHGGGAARPAAIAAVDPPAVNENAVGAGHAHPQSHALEQVGDEAGGGRLAVHSGDGADGDASLVALGKEGADDGLAHGAGNAHRGLQVHSQPRRGVDLDHHAALFIQGPADVHGHHVDAGDVQADDGGGLDGAGGHLRDGPARSRRWRCRRC